MEIWKDVKGYEGLYQVSNYGNVKSLPKKIGFGLGYLVPEKILKQAITSSGYFGVRLYINNKGKTFRIHQLVAIAFLNHIPCGHDIIVDHMDGNKQNNRLDNLQLITSRENLSKEKKNCSSKYTGVHWVTKNKKWRSQICINGKLKYLGLYTSEIEASKVYQKELETINNK
jgi:hypothetical protein